MASRSDTLPLPITMRAWTHTSPGLPAEVLHLSSDNPIPSLKPNELLIKISHAGLNPGGPVLMKLIPFLFRTNPSIPEMDFAGTIISIHPSSTIPFSRKLTVGTQVYGNIPVGQYLTKGKGALAEYVVVASDHVVKIPDQLKNEEAAGLGIPGCSALALMDHAKGLKEGDRVLINGASGGVGTLLVQMVKDVVGEEGRVVALCSGRNAEVVMGLGADEAIDYQKHDPVQKYLAEQFNNEKFDWVIDAFGSQDLWLHCTSYLKPGKPFLTLGINSTEYTWSSLLSIIGKMMSNSLKPRFLGGIDRQYVQVNGLANLKDMERLSRMVEEGKLRVLVDSIWSFNDVLPAYKKLMTKHARGKIVIRVDHEETG